VVAGSKAEGKGMAEISLQEYSQRIDEFIERGQYDEAVAHGRHVLQHYPKHLATYRLLGKAMLEVGQDALAQDMFRRVLSGDPEDLVSLVGMGITYDRQGDLQRAIWHVERAFEVHSDNQAVQEELRRLYGRRDGVEPPRVELTRAGLARLYVRGSLLSRAIEELRALLVEQPERVDLELALAEALWRNEQRVQAEEACLKVLDELPYCLKANLILGEIWVRSGRREGQVHLNRVEALDPENRLAVETMGEASPLQPREIRLPVLEYTPPTEGKERPAWLAAAELGPAPAGGAVSGGLEPTMEARVEIPAWLEGIEPGEEGRAAAAEDGGVAVPDWLLEQAAEGGEPGMPPETPGLQEEAPPDWLRDVEGFEVAPPAVPEPAGEGAVPEASAPEGQGIPSWLREIEGVEPVSSAAAEMGPAEAEVAPGPAHIPDWIKDMAPSEAPEGPIGAAQPPTDEELPEWLTEAALPIVETAEPVPAEPPAEAPAEGALPSWLEGEGLPSGDEALAWLESLTAGKEEELRAVTEAEAEARMAEIMGRAEEPVPSPAVEAGPVAEDEELATLLEGEDWLAEPEAREIAAPEEAFGWTGFEPFEAEAAPAAPGAEPLLEDLAEEAVPAEWGPPAAPPAEEAVVPEPPSPIPTEDVLGVEAEAVLEGVQMPTELEKLREYVDAQPRDYEARLALARQLWEAGSYAESLQAYGRVLRSSKWAEEVLTDVEAHAQERPADPAVRRVLGDAYVRAGRLEEALEIYRDTLEGI
jgi:tetratricopeptide (TPR) repeat protein